MDDWADDDHRRGLSTPMTRCRKIQDKRLRTGRPEGIGGLSQSYRQGNYNGLVRGAVGKQPPRGVALVEVYDFAIEKTKKQS